MKKQSTLFFMLFIFCTMSFAQKIAHINFDSLIGASPEAKIIRENSEKYMNELKTTLSEMEKEFQTKYTNYMAEKEKMGALKRTTIEDELQSMQKRIQDFNAEAEYDYQKKMNEMTAPVIDKAKKAVEAAAKENGYKYVFDLAGNIIYSEPSDDIFSASKKKMDAMPAANIPGTKPTTPINKSTTNQKQKTN